MDDRELLELAAKAAGLHSIGPYRGSLVEFMGLTIRCDDYPSGYCWNPLIDDGDALRLAVKLGISATWYEPLRYATAVYCPFGPGPVIHIEEHGIDPYAATRRAIVRAAAALAAGRGK